MALPVAFHDLVVEDYLNCTTMPQMTHNPNQLKEVGLLTLVTMNRLHHVLDHLIPQVHSLKHLLSNCNPMSLVSTLLFVTMGHV